MTRDIDTGELAEPDEAVVEFERLPQVAKRLSTRARRHIANSVSKNTIRGMRADLRVYQRAGGLLPADEFDIANFIADQRALGKRPATLERYLNSLHMWHRYMNLPSPVKSMPVRAVMRGIRRLAGTRQKEAPPLLLADLHRLLDHIDRSTLRGKRDSALFALSFHGAFRRSEVVALYLEDIQWEERGLLVGLRRSKTNQEGAEEIKPILRAPDTFAYCPVGLLEAWLSASGIRRGAVFRSIGLTGKLGAGRLTACVVAQRLAHHLEAAGMADRGFSPHSFRAGFITEAHRRGKAAVDIKRISGHRDQSTFERYIRRTDHFEGHAGDFYGGVEEALLALSYKRLVIRDSPPAIEPLGTVPGHPWPVTVPSEVSLAGDSPKWGCSARVLGTLPPQGVNGASLRPFDLVPCGRPSFLMYFDGQWRSPIIRAPKIAMYWHTPTRRSMR